MAALTTLALKALKAADEGQWLQDGGGLRGKVRVLADGAVSVTFELRFKRDGKTLSAACGSWPKHDLAEIRRTAKAHRQVLAAGTTPQEKRADETLARQAQRVEHERVLADEQARLEQQRRDSLTVADLYAEWLPVVSTKHPSKRKGRNAAGIKEIERTFGKFVLPKVGKKPLRDLMAKDVRKLMRGVAEGSGNRQAVMLLVDLRQMIRWGERTQPFKRLLAESDALAVEAHEVVVDGYDPVKDNERDRVLTPEEIRKLRDLLPASGLTDATQSALWLMLSCGTRIGETLLTRWGHVDLAARVWHIPAANTKTQTAITIYLSDFAVHQFERLKASGKAKDSDWVFPAARKDDAGLDLRAVGKQIADRQKGADAKALRGRSKMTDALALSGGRWTCHDLRRTAATLMQALGVAGEVIDRCLNHAEANRLRRIYMQHDYAADMREAWRLLGERLDLLTRDDADNVVVLRSA